LKLEFSHLIIHNYVNTVVENINMFSNLSSVQTFFSKKSYYTDEEVPPFVVTKLCELYVLYLNLCDVDPTFQKNKILKLKQIEKSFRKFEFDDSMDSSAIEDLLFSIRERMLFLKDSLSKLTFHIEDLNWKRNGIRNNMASKFSPNRIIINSPLIIKLKENSSLIYQKVTSLDRKILIMKSDLADLELRIDFYKSPILRAQRNVELALLKLNNIKLEIVSFTNQREEIKKSLMILEIQTTEDKKRRKGKKEDIRRG